MLSKRTTRVILDTSLFVNPDAQRFFGQNIEEAVGCFLEIARQKNIALFMPISIFRELSNFTDAPVLAEFRKEATVRGPDIHHLQVPAAIFQSFIRDLRGRINQGLRIAERALRREGESDTIRWVREHYRDALRTGIVDSAEDLDVVLLAKEIQGIILSADQGIANMAESLGIEVLSAEDFAKRYFS